MELRHYRYFVAVAEELHFGRAAQKLAISQPPLSFAIRQMEEELGARLFDRINKRVYLTQTGRVLLAHARDILKRSNAVQDLIRGVIDGGLGEIRLAYTPSSLLLPQIALVLRKFRQEMPKVSLKLIELDSDAQSEALLRREIDLGILRQPKQPFLKDVILDVIDEGRICLATHVTSDLARQEKVVPWMLKDESFICPPLRSGTGLRQKTLEICASAGFAPSIALEATEVTAMIGVISTQFGVAFVPDAMRALRTPGVVYRSIDHPAAHSTLFLASRPEDLSEPAARLSERFRTRTE